MSAQTLRLGFIPLNDCAPLVVARERGFFAAEGLDVELVREPSWANIRDKLAAGAIDGAHMLAPMTLAASLGAGSDPLALIAPFALNHNGSAFTVSTALVRAAKSGELAKLAHARREAGSPLRLAVVFPYSIHSYLLRDWLIGQGVDPERDVRISVAPPPRMGGQLAEGLIDGFCAGEPWGALAAAQGLGAVVMRAAELRPRSPDKVLGVTEAWAEAEPAALRAMIRALSGASAWSDAHRPELAALLSQPDYVGAPVALIQSSLNGMAFAPAGRPDPEDAVWLLEQMARWGQIEPQPDLAAVAARVYRPDLYEAALG